MSEEDLENLLKRHTENVTKVVQSDGKRQYLCHVDGEDEYESFMTDLNALGFSFYTRSAKANESNRALFSYAKKDGDLQIPFFGSPFQILKSSYMYCSMDGNYKPTTRPTLSADEPSAKKFRFSAQPTKKVGCQAIMRVKCLRAFLDDCYKLDSPYKRHCRSKNKILAQLAADLLGPSPPVGTVRFMIILSAAEEHNHSVVSTNHNQRLHPRLREEIYNLVRMSPDSTTKQVRAHLREVVRVMFEESTGARPDPENRCYYPIDHVIRFHIYRAHAALDRGGFDQDALAGYVRSWIREYPEDDFYFRPKSPGERGGGRQGRDKEDAVPLESALLFAHQTRWQRHLLRRYGNEVCLLDPAHRTCKYGFPLYFLVVKTNASDCVAGTFVVQRERAKFLEEALAHFKAWNPSWDPEYFMVDHTSTEETSAVQHTFPRTTIYASPFHRERAWDRWLAKKGNAARRSAVAIRRAWRAVAASHTEEEYANNVRDMCALDAFRDSPLARDYLFAEWLPQHDRWVEAYQKRDFVSKFNVNNGVECQRSLLNHADLCSADERTLAAVVKVLVERVLPELLDRYSLSNVPLDYREYSDSVPEFLRDRPIPFIEAVMLRYEEARERDASLVSDMGDGLFVVRSDGDADEWRSVDFVEATCSCADFASWRVPCVHMCAVFLRDPDEWGFHRLPGWYREHPYVTVDEDYAGEVGVKIDFEGDVDEREVSAEVNEEDACGEEGANEEEEEEEDGRVETGDVKEEVEEERTDVEGLMEQTREKLLAILGYTYLEHDVENAERLARSVDALDEEISGAEGEDKGTKAGLHFMAAATAAATQQREKKSRNANAKRSFPKLKIGKKHVGRCVLPAHQWRQYVNEKVDVYPPQTADQIVVIDVNHREET